MLKKNNEEYRSAIMEKPLRRAGQSLEEKIDRIFDDKVFIYVLILGLTFGCILISWVILIFPFTLKDAVILSILGLIVGIISCKKLISIIAELKCYREGLRGERFMGDHLDTLRESGCKVFHDFVGDYGNVDHIVVSSKGIYAIETKALRKSKLQKEELSYDGRKVTYNDGRELKTQPLAQALTNAKEIKKFLTHNIGEEYAVQPVVVFPNWYIKPSTYTGNKNSHDVWVCNHKYLDSLINEGPDKLTSQQVTVISNKLSDYIRNYEYQK